MGKFGIGVRVRDIDGDEGVITRKDGCGDRLVSYESFDSMVWHKRDLTVIAWEPKVGQKVKWLGKFESPFYTVGGVYEIVAIGVCGSLQVANDMGSGYWSSAGMLTENFELVAEPAQEAPAPLKLEAGKTYRTRDGRKAGPLSAYSHAIYVWTGDMDGNAHSWNKDGSFFSGLTGSGSDLVAEFVEPESAPEAFALEVGKFYKDRTGAVVGPLERHERPGTRYPWMIDRGRMIYMDDGTNYIPGGRDLVEAVAAPEPQLAPEPQPTKYKVGDRVKCIDNSGARRDFVVGDTYIVSNYEEHPFPFVNVEGVDAGMFAYRFEPSPLAIGDKVTVTGTVSHLYSCGDAAVNFDQDWAIIPATLLRAA